jgi:hypothetical protein
LVAVAGRLALKEPERLEECFAGGPAGEDSPILPNLACRPAD